MNYNLDSKGRFKNGNSGKPKGAKNKSTCLIEALAYYLIDGGYEKFKNEFNKLEGKDFIETFIKLTKFSISKETEIQANKYALEKFNSIISKKSKNK
jgi:hypothetical protein